MESGLLMQNSLRRHHGIRRVRSVRCEAPERYTKAPTRPIRRTDLNISPDDARDPPRACRPRDRVDANGDPQTTTYANYKLGRPQKSSTPTVNATWTS